MSIEYLASSIKEGLYAVGQPKYADTNAKPITRFSFTPDADGKFDPSGVHGKILPSLDGQYVLYSEFLEAINRKSPAGSLEQLADETLEQVAEFFGKCVHDPKFCGFSSQIGLDGLGKPATFTLTACEMMGDEPLRRLPV